MRVKLLAALILVVLTGLRPAGAQEAYRITGITVDATAESAVAAREMALETGQREGLRQLLRRLTRADDAGRLPDTEGLPVERYVQSFEIADERVGPTQYLATLNIAYVPAQVRDLLRSAAIPYLEEAPDPVLVVPVLAGEQGPDLWGEANPWRAAWNAGVTSPLVEIRLPLGDLGDVTTLPPDLLAAGDGDALGALGQRYGAPLVILAQARLAPGPEGLAAVEVEARAADALATPFLAEVVAATAGEEETALLARAVERTVLAIEDELKRRLLIREDELARLQLGVPLADLSDWVQIKRTLGALPEVRRVDVDRFSRSGALITIGYVGDLDALIGVMERAGLSLAEENGAWQLRQAGGLGAYQAPFSVSPATP